MFWLIDSKFVYPLLNTFNAITRLNPDSANDGWKALLYFILQQKLTIR